MGFTKPIEQFLFSNLLTKIHVFMYLKILYEEVWLMRTYEVITIVYSTIKLIVDLVKLYLEYKKSRPDTSK